MGTYMRKLFALLLLLAANTAFASVHIVDGPAPEAGGPVIRPIDATGALSLPAKEDTAGSSAPDQWDIDPATTRTYKDALTAWAKKAGWDLVWDLPKPYWVGTRGQYTGDFIFVFSSAASALGRATSPVDVTFYKGSRVVLIAPLQFSANSQQPTVQPVIHKGNKK